MRLAQGNCVGKFQKVRGMAESLVMTKDDLEDLRGQGMKQFKNVGLKTKSSLGLDFQW